MVETVGTVGNERDENIDRDRRMQSGSTGLHNGVCIAGRLPCLCVCHKGASIRTLKGPVSRMVVTT